MVQFPVKVAEPCTQLLAVNVKSLSANARTTRVLFEPTTGVGDWGSLCVKTALRVGEAFVSKICAATEPILASAGITLTEPLVQTVEPAEVKLVAPSVGKSTLKVPSAFNTDVTMGDELLPD